MELLEIAKTYIDWPVALRSSVGAAPPFRTYVVERPRNAANVAALRSESPALHAYDFETGRKAPKFALLGELIARYEPEPDEWIVIADDDVLITRGSLRRFVAIAARCQFDLAQPSHDRRGFVNFGITLSKPLSRVRATSFVEIGPIFAVNPRARERVLGTFSDVGMGWGLEAVWWDMGLRLGIVDEVRMRHLAPAAEGYDIAYAARERDDLVLRRYRITRPQPHDTIATIPVWRSIRPMKPRVDVRYGRHRSQRRQ